MTLTERLSEYVRACFTGIWIQSHEHNDALTEIANLCREESWRLVVWDIESGLNIPDQTLEENGSSSDPLAVIRSPNTLASADSAAILVLQNFHQFLGSPEVKQALARQILHGCGW